MLVTLRKNSAARQRESYRSQEKTELEPLFHSYFFFRDLLRRYIGCWSSSELLVSTGGGSSFSGSKLESVS